ncbi:MAG: class 1 fructose-bisphosphatase [Acidobacteria bacterium]|nr:class 1 fructose-bisphosphatase [Acidobacteriota bacterium]
MLITVQHHILQQQEDLFPEARGNFSSLLSGMTLATKMIQAKIRRAGLVDILGAAGETNVQGEAQQKLDVYANQAVLHCLGARESVAMMVSEENAQPITLDRSETGKYIIVFDPLDGSSNIDVNVSVGTIFSILRRPDGVHGEAAVLQPGWKQVAAGYVLYGSSTIFVYTAGHGVFGFTLEPEIGAFVLTFPNMKMPAQGAMYSVNEANVDTFPDSCRAYLSRLRERGYSSRYIGSLVADFHRTLLKGGVFLYPPTKKNPQGKLRLLYEANPLAFVAEQAGGQAIAGGSRIMDIEPRSIHERTPLIIGSKVEVGEYYEMQKG